MAEEKRELPTRRFNCPADLFGPGKFIDRRRFIKTRNITALENAIKVDQDLQKAHGIMARYIAEWNLDDCETGEPLPQPGENPDVFNDVDTGEQLVWIVNEVFLSPNPQRPK